MDIFGINDGEGNKVAIGPGFLLIFDTSTGCLEVSSEKGDTIRWNNGDNKIFYPSGLQTEKDFEMVMEVIAQIFSFFYLRVNHGNGPMETSNYFAFKLLTREQYLDVIHSGYTVSDLRELFKKNFSDFLSGRGEYSEEKKDKLFGFYEKINVLGRRNIDRIPPEECKDIDATVILTPKEWRALTAEMSELSKME